MKQFPKVSIVTPSFNQGKFLERTILSVLDQKYPNLEYVIIDGGSTDGSQKIIKKYQKHLHFWESKRDRGQSHAINKGFEKTDGEVMAWINSDDILRPGSLRLVASIFDKFNEINWLTSLPSTINDQDYQLYLAQPPLYLRNFIQRGWYTRKFMGFIMQEGTFWRRSLWKKAGGKLEEVPYSMDLKLWQSFSEHEKLYCVHACLASYRLNPDRKNNDSHQSYYQEINSWMPEKISLVGKILWRQIAKMAHHAKLSPAIYYDQEKLEWCFRKNLFDVESFKLLSNTPPGE
ncbi:MAG: glycosyltransferase [Candidatus Pacebacteria bacterium]|jgi:O-antigen biosynthesis protein|nr:glycosyltransferase [Candidatus Paceibacterota bacterium]MBT4004743.1 glycosyltransferase [Candidatus Paceibacterota bacterium]MBT6899266.1 glycosyltransferase [Candidatus Paceibacterota bacterium]MBT7184166.1 glycosyltransferase [Candidatus Paceibacterota bacterium]MBT7310002.1 glycosyltransferase [Candidatus Paceibacterota bacterium]